MWLRNLFRIGDTAPLELFDNLVVPGAATPADLGVGGEAPSVHLFPANKYGAEATTTRTGRTRKCIGLAVKVAERGLEGFSGGMLAFAALKPNVGGLSAQLSIGILAFFGIVFLQLCTILPWLEHKKESLGQAANQLVKEAKPGDPSVQYAVARTLLEANASVLALRMQISAEIKADVVGCLAGVLWNLAAGNGLVQNGFVGLISSAVAGASVFLSWWCCRHSSNTIRVSLEKPTGWSDLRDRIDQLQYWIAAPILVGLGCAVASVLGAVILFHKASDRGAPPKF